MHEGTANYRVIAPSAGCFAVSQWYTEMYRDGIRFSLQTLINLWNLDSFFKFKLYVLVQLSDNINLIEVKL